jgi:NTE family protein
MKKYTIFLISLLLCACAGAPPSINIPTTQPMTQENLNHPRVVLVLGGGGARGIAHIGVIQTLQQAGIPIDMIIGTSAGAIIGALYADQGNIAHAKQVALNTGFAQITDFNNFPSSEGIFKGYKLQKLLLNNMKAKNFDQLKIPLIVMTTDLTTGASVPISSGPVAPAVQASAALPGLFDPVHLYGHVLIDGGIADPIAVNVAQQYHPDVIIAVNVTEQLTGPAPTTAESVSNRAYLITRLQMSNRCLIGANIVISPAVGNASVFDTGKGDALYIAGQQAALKELPAIKALLKEKGIALNPV